MISWQFPQVSGLLCARMSARAQHRDLFAGTGHDQFGVALLHIGGTAGDHPVSDSGDRLGYAGDRRDARTHADGGGR